MQKKLAQYLIACAMVVIWSGDAIAQDRLPGSTFRGGGALHPVRSATTAAPTTAGNLILNPQLETSTITPGLPDHWNEGNWGTNTVKFTYPVAGQSGDAAEVTISAYTSGDAKWYFDNVPVTPFASYTLTYWYRSNVPSSPTVQFTAGTTLTYLTLAVLPSSNNVWVSTVQTITVPAGVTALTVFPLISAVGSITVDNFSLVQVAGTGPVTFPTGLVSLAFDDGWSSQYVNAFPLLQAAKMPATFYIISNPMFNSEETIFPSTDNPLTAGNTAATAKSVVWSQIYTDPTQHNFTFADTYTATGANTITVSYTPATGSASSLVVGSLAAGTNAKATFNFTLPQLAPSTPITVTQALTGSTGTLTATSPLLTEAIGYMSVSQVLALQAGGMEIGNHTLNHCDLLLLLANPSSATIPPAQANAACPNTGPLAAASTTTQEIDGARTALLGIGASPVTTFAYPYGDGAGNATIEAEIAADGMIAARSITAGYNVKTTDPFNLYSQLVEESVPDFSTVQAWIDYAVANKVWLVLTFHQVEATTTILSQNGEIYGTTTAMVQSIVNYLVQQKAAGKLVVGTVHDIFTQYQ